MRILAGMRAWRRWWCFGTTEALRTAEGTELDGGIEPRMDADEEAGVGILAERGGFGLFSDTEAQREEEDTEAG